MPLEDINPTDAFSALQWASVHGQGDTDAAVRILLEAGVVVEIQRA